MQLLAEKEILTFVASPVHCCAINKTLLLHHSYTGNNIFYPVIRRCQCSVHSRGKWPP